MRPQLNSNNLTNEFYEQFDPRYFFDYTEFVGMLRYYVTQTLKEAFESDDTDADSYQKHRRLFIAGLYKEEYASYEDMGAILRSFLLWRKDDVKYPVEVILNYDTRDVMLKKLFAEMDISSPDVLYQQLGLEQWLRPKWNETHPDINPEKVLRTICKFAFDDCTQMQKKHGIKAYNKLKHGLVFVPNSKRYKSNAPDAPGIIFKNPEDERDPYIILSIVMDNRVLNERCRNVNFVQSSLRTLAGFYLCHRYPEFLKSIDIMPPESLFLKESLSNLLDFMKKVTEND